MQFKRSFTTIAMGVLSLIALASVCQAHVGLSSPCARNSPVTTCPNPPNGQRDFELNSPIGTFGSKDKPFCRTTNVMNQRTVVRAGQNIDTSYRVGAPHGGGHCQWALSYDGGQTWAVVHTLIRSCLQGVQGGQPYSVSVPIPKNAPNGKATFMWLWNNAIGNRELYSNCADIEIRGGSNAKTFKALPLVVANYGPDSHSIPEFPNPGDNDGSDLFKNLKPISIPVKGN
ncbi:hypothetical protein BGX31_007536 [Mortierella sp. GBA43]|nr:hypothetical protein BGX31_007536 [Mortierella sp. GBA43]